MTTDQIGAVDGVETFEVDAAVATDQALPGRSLRVPRPHPVAWVRGGLAGMTAIGTKELRGRMRGRRAFVILTVYLVLLAAFAAMMELILERRLADESAGSAASASALIGQGIFAALILLQTLLVIALAPAFTAGTISLEREKQTLDMLATTPVSSLSIVVGKLFSALTYLFILILASIPLTAIVFVFGGVSPDAAVRSYVVLLATAVGLGSIGLFCSALLKRTQAATIATYFGVLGVTLGTFFIFYFWNAMSAPTASIGVDQPRERSRPPEELHVLNPYFAQVDILCGVENGFGDWCTRLAFVTQRTGFGDVDVIPPLLDPEGAGFDLPARGVKPGVVEDRLAPVGVEQFGVPGDRFWPKSVAAWLGLAGILIVASIQLVSPTRRWRIPRPGNRR